MQNLWPRLEGSYQITAGQEVRLTVQADAAVSMEPVPRFPVNYANFTAMAEIGDTIFIGRYLVRASRTSCCATHVDSLWDRCRHHTLSCLSSRSHQLLACTVTCRFSGHSRRLHLCALACCAAV